MIVPHLSSKVLAFPSHHTIQIKVRQAICHRTLTLFMLPNPLKEMINMLHTLLGGTQTKLANLKGLCHNSIVIEQSKKRWSIDSPLPIHRVQQSTAAGRCHRWSINLFFFFFLGLHKIRVLVSCAYLVT